MGDWIRGFDPSPAGEGTTFECKADRNARQDLGAGDIKRMTPNEATNAADHGSALSDELGVAVLVDGAVVAWFAEMDEGAEDYCRERLFGRWLTWRAKQPEIVPLTPEELARCETAARKIAAILHGEDA